MKSAGSKLHRLDPTDRPRRCFRLFDRLQTAGSLLRLPSHVLISAEQALVALDLVCADKTPSTLDIAAHKQVAFAVIVQHGVGPHRYHRI